MIRIEMTFSGAAEKRVREGLAAYGWDESKETIEEYIERIALDSIQGRVTSAEQTPAVEALSRRIRSEVRSAVQPDPRDERE